MHANEFKYSDDGAAVLRWTGKKWRINECTNTENDDQRATKKKINKIPKCKLPLDDYNGQLVIYSVWVVWRVRGGNGRMKGLAKMEHKTETIQINFACSFNVDLTSFNSVRDGVDRVGGDIFCTIQPLNREIKRIFIKIPFKISKAINWSELDDGGVKMQ